MNTYYILSPTNSDIVHFGKGHDDNPPGRGSGRFPFGTGKRPRQHVEENKPKDKEAILKSADPHAILSIQDELTNKELNAAINRIQAINTLKAYDKAGISNGWKTINNVNQGINDVYRWGNTGKRTWNIFATAFNAVYGIKHPYAKKLPRIP